MSTQTYSCEESKRLVGSRVAIETLMDDKSLKSGARVKHRSTDFQQQRVNSCLFLKIRTGLINSEAFCLF